MENSAVRPSFMYKSGQNILSIVKEEKDLGVVIQDLSAEKHIYGIFGDTFMLKKIYGWFLIS